VNELVAPLRAIARAAFDARRRTRERRRARRDEEREDDKNGGEAPMV
jgi:hypothetical protein